MAVIPAPTGANIPERLLLFCVASGTDWEHAGITGATVTVMVVRGLIERDAALGAVDRRASGDVID